MHPVFRFFIIYQIRRPDIAFFPFIFALYFCGTVSETSVIELDFEVTFSWPKCDIDVTLRISSHTQIFSSIGLMDSFLDIMFLRHAGRFLFQSGRFHCYISLNFSKYSKLNSNADVIQPKNIISDFQSFIFHCILLSL